MQKQRVGARDLSLCTRTGHKLMGGRTLVADIYTSRWRERRYSIRVRLEFDWRWTIRYVFSRPVCLRFLLYFAGTNCLRLVRCCAVVWINFRTVVSARKEGERLRVSVAQISLVVHPFQHCRCTKLASYNVNPFEMTVCRVDLACCPAERLR